MRPTFNGQYTGQMYTSTDGSRWVWVNDNWQTAGYDYATPNSRPRDVNISFSTFIEGSNTPIEVRVLVNGNPWNDVTYSKGKAVVHFFENQLISPVTISFESNNTKSTKTFVVQSGAEQKNEVLIRELDENGIFVTPPTIDVIGRGAPGGGGGYRPDYNLGDRMNTDTMGRNFNTQNYR
jgi:hypothetical protein